MPRPTRKKLKFDEESVNKLLQEIYDESFNIKAKIVRLFTKWEIKVKEGGDIAAIGDQVVKLIAAESKNQDQKIMLLKYLKEVVFDNYVKAGGVEGSRAVEDTGDVTNDRRNELLDMVQKEFDPFLLDVLKVVVGSEALKQLTGELFTNFIAGVEPQMKSSLTKQTVQYNAGDSLPTGFKTTGINVPVKDIDVYAKLKTDPASAHGDLLYDNTKPNFDSKARQAIQNAGTDTTYNNMIIKYNSSTDSFNFKPTVASSSGTIGDWMGGYIKDTVIVDKKEFLTNTMNAVYGSVTANQNKTVEQVYQELQINKLLEQLIDDDNDSFEISQNDYDALLQKAQALVDGVVYYDMGCGMIGAKLPFNDMTNLISQISGATDRKSTRLNSSHANI